MKDRVPRSSETAASKVYFAWHFKRSLRTSSATVLLDISVETWSDDVDEHLVGLSVCLPRRLG